jgi:SprT protein
MLEATARNLLVSLGQDRLGAAVRVEWNTRLRSAAGRADLRKGLVSLNPLLRNHGSAEIDRTLRHELAHLLAQARAGRRRLTPHGREWRRACCDLDLADEARCHQLPFPIRRRPRRFLYRCPKCRVEFHRARRIRRALACLSCCRKFNDGRFHARFRLQLVQTAAIS